MQSIPFQSPALNALTQTATHTPGLELKLEATSHALSQLPGVLSLALWGPGASGDAELRHRYGKGAPLALWPKEDRVRQEFGRRPFLLDEASKPHYAKLGLAGPSIAIFDLGQGYYCGLGLDLAHDGSAGAAVKALRQPMEAWVKALKAFKAPAPAPRAKRRKAPSLAFAVPLLMDEASKAMHFPKAA